MKVYFDNAATTPLDQEVLDEMLPVLREGYGNPSSIHAFGRKSKSLIETARRKVASYFNVSPGEIFFTSGGTEADNMAIWQSVTDLGIKRIISSPLEHHAVLHTIEMLEKRGLVKVEMLKLLDKGVVDLNDLEKRLKSSKEKTLVSLMHANNEIGNLLPLEKAAEMIKEFGAIFHSDTVQTVGHYNIDLQKIPVDFIACAAHKFHGPKGIGFLYIRNDIKIQPLIYGGSQERNMRGGTENIYGIVGLAKALEISLRDMEKHTRHITALKQHMKSSIEKNIPGASFNGLTGDDSLYTVLNVCLPPSSRGEMLLYALDIAGIAASAGSACSSGSNTGSHVLRNIGTDMTRPSLRFSFSKYNTISQVDYCVEELKKLIN